MEASGQPALTGLRSLASGSPSSSSSWSVGPSLLLSAREHLGPWAPDLRAPPAPLSLLRPLSCAQTPQGQGSFPGPQLCPQGQGFCLYPSGPPCLLDEQTHTLSSRDLRTSCSHCLKQRLPRSCPRHPSAGSRPAHPGETPSSPSPPFHRAGGLSALFQPWPGADQQGTWDAGQTAGAGLRRPSGRRRGRARALLWIL